MTFTIGEQIEEVMREIYMRERVYPNLVASRRMTSTQAGCPPWNPLMSETVVVFIDVDESGVEKARCVRVRERSTVRPRVRL